jgi:hypothetical protein
VARAGSVAGIHPGRVSRALVRLRRRVQRRPFDAGLTAAAVLVCAWVLVEPFTVVRYPPLTDLPMHAASIAAFRHWFDPTWHFQDQFEFHPLEVPYLTQYTLGALFALVMPIGWAVKLSTSVMLGLLPAGLAVYCKGLHKSPLMGIAGAAFTWGTLTHWGFINMLGGVGLMLMGLGLALMQLERPSRGRALGLCVVSLLLFATHVFRFPFYCVGLALAAVLLWPANRRLLSIVLPVLPSLALFVAWWVVRPKSMEGTFEHGFHKERVIEIASQLMQSYAGPEEPIILAKMLKIIEVIALYSLFWKVASWLFVPRAIPATGKQVWRAIGGFFLTASVTAMFAFLFFWLPMSIGFWWYVYPREITVAAICGLAVLPTLPRSTWLKAPAVGALAYAILLPTGFAAKKFAEWDQVTSDFAQIMASIPKAPKLAYLVEDRSGFDTAMQQPFLHLPAWVQAEKGGWLSFHFAIWNASPLRFRVAPPRDVPPETPPRFEWHPEWFDMKTRGLYFDWFLIRSRWAPDRQMAIDPTLERVAHQGTWWLYRRGGGPNPGSSTLEAPPGKPGP